MVEVRAACQVQFGQQLCERVKVFQGINQHRLVPVPQDLRGDAQIFFRSSLAFFNSTEFQDRPEGARLFQTIQAADLVIFPKLDRAFRNTRNALNVLHELKGRGVSVHFIDLGGDVTGNGVGAIVFTILSAFATFERERIAARIREVKQLRKAQGKFTGGRRAFGYDVIDGVKVPREDEQAVIRQIRAMREAGAGYREIAQWMKNTHERGLSFMGVKRVLNVSSAP